MAPEAGLPLGEQGEGFGSVDAVWTWADGAGRTIPAQGGGTTRPGDLFVWDEHIGLVEKVLSGGRVQTIEGNSSDHVARRVHSMSESIVGYVRMRCGVGNVLATQSQRRIERVSPIASPSEEEPHESELP